MSQDSCGEGGGGQTLYGKYRGKVVSTEDLSLTGKLLCEVPALPGMLLNWATPAVSYPGLKQGMFALPEEGSDVWIEFEQGNPDYPIWSGGYWEEGATPPLPVVSKAAPEIADVYASKFSSLVMDDTPVEGSVQLSIGEPAVALPVTMKMSSAGFSVKVGIHSITIDPKAGITLTSGDAKLTLSPQGQSTTAPSIDHTAVGKYSVKAATAAVNSPTTISSTLNVEALATLQAAKVNTELNVTGPSTLVGGATVGERLSSEGESSFTGPTTMSGPTTIGPDLLVEGGITAAVVNAPVANTQAAAALTVG
jgi:hypothetical protein